MNSVNLLLGTNFRAAVQSLERGLPVEQRLSPENDAAGPTEGSRRGQRRPKVGIALRHPSVIDGLRGEQTIHRLKTDRSVAPSKTSVRWLTIEIFERNGK